LTILPLTTLLLRNLSRFGEGRDEALTRLDLGSSADFTAGPYLEGTFLLEPGLEGGVRCDVGGLV